MKTRRRATAAPVWILHCGADAVQKAMATPDMRGRIVGRSGSWLASADGTYHTFNDLRDAKRWTLAKLRETAA